MRPRRAFALPTVILVMLILVGALASGFGMLSSERGADDAAIQSQTAAALAETGLQQGLRNRSGLGLPAFPSSMDSVRLTLTGGYADIVTTRLRAASGTLITGLYLVRSRGVATATGVAGAGNAVAMSTAFATSQVMTLTVPAALTSINGVYVYDGNSQVISGVDACSLASGGTGASLAAVALPDVHLYSSSRTALTGTPQILSLGATATEASNTVQLDWASIVSGTSITPDFRSDFRGNGFPTATWFTSNPSSWPTIIVNNGPSPNNRFTLNSLGRGLLIVYGDLNLDGNSAGWDGIILIGGKYLSNANRRSPPENRVAGAIVTGLNVKLGYAVTATDVDSLTGTNKPIRYNSCNVNAALRPLGALRVYQNSWANNFPSY